MSGPGDAPCAPTGGRSRKLNTDYEIHHLLMLIVWWYLMAALVACLTGFWLSAPVYILALVGIVVFAGRLRNR